MTTYLATTAYWPPTYLTGQRMQLAFTCPLRVFGVLHVTATSAPAAQRRLPTKLLYAIYIGLAGRHAVIGCGVVGCCGSLEEGVGGLRQAAQDRVADHVLQAPRLKLDAQQRPAVNGAGCRVRDARC